MNLTHTVGQLTLSGGNLSLGSNSFFTTGSLGTPGSRILKGWFTSLEVTNAPTINGVSIATTYAPINSPQFTGTVILPTTTSIGTVSSTEIGYVDNVTSPIQTQINNVPTNILPSALLLGDYAWLKTDTTYGQAKQVVTQTQLASFEGGGSGLGIYRLRGIVGTTEGFPVNGDSIIINTGFITHPDIELFRDGSLQWYNMGLNNNTGILEDTYVFNQTTGTIIVRPTFMTGEKVIVKAVDPIIVHELVPEGGTGGGGDPGGSTLLTDLIAYWQLDETTGSTFVDEVGTNDGTTTATRSSTAKIGYALDYDTNTDYGSVPYNATLAFTGDTLSIAFWMKLDALPTGVYAWLYTASIDAIPYSSVSIYIASDGRLRFKVINTTNVEYVAQTGTTPFVTGTWYHIIGVLPPTGPLELYINNVSSATSADTFVGALKQFTDPIYLGNNSDAATFAPNGQIDEVGVWNGVLRTARRCLTL